MEGVTLKTENLSATVFQKVQAKSGLQGMTVSFQSGPSLASNKSWSACSVSTIFLQVSQDFRQHGHRNISTFGVSQRGSKSSNFISNSHANGSARCQPCGYRSLRTGEDQLEIDIRQRLRRQKSTHEIKRIDIRAILVGMNIGEVTQLRVQGQAGRQTATRTRRTVENRNVRCAVQSLLNNRKRAGA